MKMIEFEDDKARTQVVHFNRIAMQRGDDAVWTVHNSVGCFNVNAVQMHRPMITVYNPNGRQPRAKFKGVARLWIKDGIAYLL